MSKTKIITKEIAGFYAAMQWKKKFDDWYKEILEEKFTTFNEKKVICNGIIHQTKKRTNWKWKPEVYAYLKTKKVLGSAVSLKEKQLTRYNLEAFELPETTHLRMTPKRLTVKEKAALIQAEFEKITGTTIAPGVLIDEALFKKTVREKEFEEIVNFYKVNKLLIKQLEQKYEKRKEMLFQEMQKNNVLAYKCPDGNGYKINKNKTEYDIDAIVVSQIPKNYSFTYKVVSKDGDVHVIDLLNNGREFFFQNETMYEGQRISLYKGRLHVNGQRLRTDVRAIFENPTGFYPATGDILVDCDDLFSNCPISSTKIDELIDLGELDMRTIEGFKYKSSEDDVTEYFEVISEISEEARKNMFKEKLEARLALQKQKITPIFSEMDEEEEENDNLMDLFALESYI